MAPRVHTLALPNPLFEGSINAYLIEAAPLTLIDSGIGTRTCFAALEEALSRLGHAVEDIEQIVLTHKHADHIGLASRIVERSGARVYIHADDLDGLIQLDRRHEEYPALVRGRLAEWGVDQTRADSLTQALAQGPRFARQTVATPLQDGDRLPVGDVDLEVIHTPGHTQGSICLRYGDTLFSGDHVLPGISPNIGASELRRSGMLRRYLTALDRVAALDDGGMTVLPGHGEAFTALAERCRQLAAHHAEREAKIVTILAEGDPMTVHDVSSRLWRELPGFHLLLGAAEANAHLEKLAEEGRATVEANRFKLVSVS